MSFNTPQEKFWAQDHAHDYIARNRSFDHDLGARAWATMLAKAERPVRNFLECGCNIGRNITQLAQALPEAQPSIIEIRLDPEAITPARTLSQIRAGAK